MSFEGFYQLSCEEGHYWNACYGYGEEEMELCPDCNKKPVFRNLVDDTNCDNYGELPEVQPPLRGDYSRGRRTNDNIPERGW